MIVSSLLAEVLRRADMEISQADIFTADEVSGWPTGALDSFCGAGLLVAAQPATTVVCDACFEDHWGGVQFVEAPTGTPRRAYIVCPEAGRVAVDPDRLRRWQVDLSSLAQRLAGILGGTALEEESVLGRLWSLGTAAVGGERYRAFLARGLAWPDAAPALNHERWLDDAEPALVFALDQAPSKRIPAAVVPLSRALLLENGRLALDWSYVGAVVNADAAGHGAGEEREEPEFIHSSDYRSVWLHGREFILMPPAAAVIRILHRGRSTGTPDVAWERIRAQLASVGSYPQRMSDVFKRITGWRDLVISRRRGTYRLKL